ncbi:hypothetical protein EDB84DRAFT_1573125 [Lactarius hengduanensis]|nr:hypothetical protein EDB84DRAFT_1573125 [Lactarius hengduanensis]
MSPNTVPRVTWPHNRHLVIATPLRHSIITLAYHTQDPWRHPQHSVQDPCHRQPAETTPQHSTEAPHRSHAPSTRHARPQPPLTPTPPRHGAQHAKTPPPPTHHVAPTRCAIPRHTPTYRHTKTPPRHPNAVRNTPPTVTTPTPSAPPYIHTIYGTSTSLQ